MNWRFFFWVALLLALDQVTKYLVRTNMNLAEIITVIPGVFDINFVYNPGIAFGLLPGLGQWLAPLALAVAIVAGVSYARAPEGDRLYKAGMTLLAAGALGNLFDRVFNGGKVTDFIDIKIIHVFNLADACITAAAALLGFHLLMQAKGEIRGRGVREPESPSTPDQPAQ